MIFFLRPKESKRLFKLTTKACHVVSIASNIPIVTCLGYQSAFKKLTNAKTFGLLYISINQN
jgi:hypothetical protein